VGEIHQTATGEKIKARKERASRKAAARVTASVGAPSRRRSERAQGQPAPVYNERALNMIDDPPTGTKKDRRILKGKQQYF
jgi:hypothetical protein